MIFWRSRWGRRIAGATIGFAAAVGFFYSSAQASDSGKRRAGLPEPVSAENFSELQQHSPFLRSVGLSDSILLTGVATIEGEVVVTLLDTETAESRVVSRSADSDGWQLVEMRGDETDVESLIAKVQVNGGEVISIRYEKPPVQSAVRAAGNGPVGPGRLSDRQMREAKEAAENYREGFSSDGYPRQPPPDVVRKLQRMSSRQREVINREMIDLRNRGLGMEERRRIYNQKLDRALGGR